MIKNENVFRYLFEKSASPAILISDDMTVVMANQRAEELFGYSKDEIEGKIKWPTFIHADDVERMKDYHVRRRRDAGDPPAEYECRVIDGGGEVQDFFMKIDMVPGTRMSLATFINVTSRKRAEKNLREREEELRAIVDNFEGYIYTCFPNYTVEFMNRSLIRRVGRDATGELCYRAIYNLDSPCPGCPIRDVFGGKTVKTETYDSVSKRWFAKVSIPISDHAGNVVRQQAMLTDIHERKLAEQEMRVKKEKLQKENYRLKATMKERYKFGDIIGKSPEMQAVYELILNAAASDAGVIIYGESGTGKELAAKAIHSLSDRGQERFVPVNCGAIPENLMESEFFGYEKGGFSGAGQDKPGYLDMADKGTLFLDELGEIDLKMQVKLLRAIDGGGFIPIGGKDVKVPDFRIIAATNRNLAKLMTEGLLREDFFYRIHIVPIRIPPLRERREDIPLLVDHFLNVFGEKGGFPPVTPTMLDMFYGYDWPGNVRELQNILRRYVALKTFDFNGTPFVTLRDSEGAGDYMPETEGRALRSVLDDVEKKVIVETLEKNHWHRGDTANALGINRRTLERKMKHYSVR